MTTNTDAIARRSLSAAKWNYLGAIARFALQFPIGIMLARLLGPDAFGLVAIASLVIGLGSLFSDFGLASALIQRPSLTAADIRYIFSWQSLVGLLLTLLLEAAAPWLADWFQRPDALAIMRAMFVVFALQGLGMTAQALLRRQLDFKGMQIAQTGSYVVGYGVVGLPLAWSGYGAWSLVAAQLLQATVVAVAGYAMTRHPVLPAFRHPEGQHGFLKFGFTVTLTYLCNWGLSNLDSLLAGRCFGASALGVYNRALNLVSMPAFNIMASLQSVLMSAASRKQNDIAWLSRTYLAIMGAIGFLCIPVFLVVATIPQTVILGVYGPAWHSATALLPPLSLAMILSVLMGMSGPLLTAMGLARRELHLQAASLLLYLPLLYWIYDKDLQALSWALCAIYALRCALMMHAALQALATPWSALAACLAGPLALGVLCATGVSVADHAFAGVAISDGSRLTLLVVVSAALLLTGFMLLQRHCVAPPVASLIARLLPALPAPVRKFFSPLETLQT